MFVASLYPSMGGRDPEREKSEMARCECESRLEVSSKSNDMFLIL